MSDDNYKVQVSLSLPPAAQYAKGDMINFRGNTVAEVHLLLQEALSVGLLTKAVEAAKVYLIESGLGAGASDPVPGLVNPNASGGMVVPFPTPATPVPTPAPMCQHGKRTWKAGNGAKGDWYAWFCPAPKGAPDQCAPIWASADGTARD